MGTTDIRNRNEVFCIILHWFLEYPQLGHRVKYQRRRLFTIFQNVENVVKLGGLDGNRSLWSLTTDVNVPLRPFVWHHIFWQTASCSGLVIYYYRCCCCIEVEKDAQKCILNSMMGPWIGFIPPKKHLKRSRPDNRCHSHYVQHIMKRSM